MGRALGAAAPACLAAVAMSGCDIAIGGGSAGPADPAGGGNARTLGPEGLGPFKLGMTLDQAEATGEWKRRKETVGACMSDTGSSGITVGWSGRLGISSLTADNVRTPEGIGTGSTFAEVKAAYRRPVDGTGTLEEDAQLMGTVWTAVPGNPKAMYAILFNIGGGMAPDHVEGATVRLVVLKLKAEQRC
ncbi:hypothetical protein [Streptomyces sp. TLI_146]|uniref:hypothetical protein n=1 Tax=Streptomyces sp. TLI_146 TaxID=1938858 RepID=UPI000C6FDA30|nr:hypothetical protein [Streptomyces sp. TLI_146]